MTFAEDWLRRARARHRARELISGATTVRVLRIHPRHGKTMAAAAVLAAGITMVSVPGTLVVKGPWRNW